jgi:large subunit ribosomal protein L17
MKHRVAGRKLGRTSSHRLALLRNLSRELFANERITTTLGKAKELRPFAEKIVTMSKRETLHARRQVLRHIHDNDVVAKLFDTISARFAQRPGGYTRIVKLGPRRGDSAEMAIIELVGAEARAKPEAPAATKDDARKGKAKAKAEKTAGEKKAKPKKEAGDKAKAEKKPKARAAKAKPATKSKSSSRAKGATKTTAPRKSGGS